MAGISEIYREFYSINSNDSAGIIRLYEKNKIFLDNKSTFKDKNDFNNFVLLVSHYIINLEKVGKYSKAVKYAGRLLRLIDFKKEEYNINQKDFTIYWTVMASKGRALFYLKDYKNS